MRKKSTVTFDPGGRHLIIPVRLTRKSKKVIVRAVVDTGASSTVIDKSVAKSLGITGKALVRTRSAQQVRGRLTIEKGRVDKIEIMGVTGTKCLCSIGPVMVRVTRFGEAGMMLLGSDVMSFVKMKIDLDPDGFILSCTTPKDLIGVFSLGHALGVW